MATIVTTGANAFDSLLKIKYGDLYKAIKEQSVTLNAVKAKKTKSDGLKFLWPIMTGRAGGTTTNYSEGGTLPQGVKPIMPQAEVYTTRMASVLRVSGDLVHKGDRGEAAIESELKLLLQNLVENHARQINQQMLGFPVRTLVNGAAPISESVNGVLGQVNGAPTIVGSTATFNVDRPLGYQNADLGSTWYSKNFRINDFLAYGTVASAAPSSTFTPDGYVQITAIDAATSTITATVISNSGGAIANNDWLVPCSGASASVNNFGKALNGFGVLLDQAADSNGQLSFQNVGLTPNNIRAYGTAKVQSGGTFVESDWHSLLAKTRAAHMGTPSIAIMDETLRNLFMEVTKADVRLTPWKIQGGFTSVEFASQQKIDLICEPEMPYGMAFFLDPQNLRWLNLSEPAWESGGATFGNHLRQIPGEDAFEAVYTHRCQFGFDLLNAHGVYYGCQITNPSL
tara:strand:+ start:197 stop:1564 length:1368 start_codon:yes stop_codon:yes gene_type:complete